MLPLHYAKKSEKVLLLVVNYSF